MFQVELEKLNKASEEINRLELELDVCFSHLLHKLLFPSGLC